jgi:hypothetical protein
MGVFCEQCLPFACYFTSLAVSRLYVYTFEWQDERRIGKDLEQGRPWPNRNTIPALTWTYRGKLRRASIRTASVSAEIRTEHLPNTSLDRCRRFVSRSVSSVFILSAHLCFGITNGLFACSFSIKIEYFSCRSQRQRGLMHEMSSPA